MNERFSEWRFISGMPLAVKICLLVALVFVLLSTVVSILNINEMSQNLLMIFATVFAMPAGGYAIYRMLWRANRTKDDNDLNSGDTS